MVATDFLSSAVILTDLEKIYLMALEKENLSIALKAKELLGRACGLFSAAKNRSFKPSDISFDDFSNEDLTYLIEKLEAKLKLDP